MSATNKHYISFGEYICLYLPHFLRPSLPRDMRTLGTSRPATAESVPPPTGATSAGARAEGDGGGPASPPPTPKRKEDGGGSLEIGNGTQDGDGCVAGMGQDEPVSKGRQRVASSPTTGNKERTREGYHVALILTNSGSTARDHLASERTFLAYVRTSLALSSTGVALVQLFTIADVTRGSSDTTASGNLMRRWATPLGSTIIALGLVVLILGSLRYFAIQTALTRGVFPAARMTIVFVVVTLSALTGIVFGVLVGGKAS